MRGGVGERGAYVASQMAAVRPGELERGVGGRLKAFQRREALARGMSGEGGTFDRLVVKNAYVGRMLLGAVARR